MKYAHLDKLADEDDDSIQPMDVIVFVNAGDDREVHIAGYPSILMLKDPLDLTPVITRLQRYVDSLSNSGAAMFLETNRNNPHPKSHRIAIRVPKVIFHALPEQVPAG